MDGLTQVNISDIQRWITLEKEPEVQQAIEEEAHQELFESTEVQDAAENSPQNAVDSEED